MRGELVTLNLPSTITLHDGSDRHFLDVNFLYWQRLLSTRFVRRSFRQYEARFGMPEPVRTSADYVLRNLARIRAIHGMAVAHPHRERALLYAFNCYRFITDVLEALHPSYRFTVSYGPVLNAPAATVERLVDDPGNLLARFLRSLIARRLFRDGREYRCQVRWEIELPHVLMLSILLRRAFDNVRISIDLGGADEQVDLSNWFDHPLIRRHVDRITNQSADEGGRERRVVRGPASGRRVTSCAVRHGTLYGTPKLTTRLCPTKCFWHQCAFCVINSRFTSERVCADVDDESIASTASLVAHLRSLRQFAYLVLTDEAIAAPVLLHFARQLIQHGIEVGWVARTRFSEQFSPDACRVLAQSGLRVLMFGLESANDRVVRLMNKRERPYSKAELNRILANCDAQGIRPHVFFMLGFPSETKAETAETLAMVEENLAERRFFTFSANVFGLMRGSDVHRRPGAYGIELAADSDDTRLGSLKYVDHGPGDKYTRDELWGLAKTISARLLFERVEDADTADAGYYLWSAMDRTGCFGDHQLVNQTNPYLRRNPFGRLTPEVASRRYHLLPIMWSDDQCRSFLNVVDHRMVEVAASIRAAARHFIAHFSSRQTLQAGMDAALAATGLRLEPGGQAARDWDALVLELLNSSILYER